MFFRITGFFVGGFCISLVLLSNLDTYSWFSKSFSENISVSAARKGDIIQEVEFDNTENPTQMTIRKAEKFDGNPTVYFSVTGDIAEYILHINPIRLETNGDYIIPIEPNLNSNQYMSLFLPWLGNKTGRIVVSYHNDFIIHEYEVTFTNKYLRDIFRQNITRKGTQLLETDSESEAKSELVSLITYIASHITWENNDENQSQQSMQMSTMSIMDSNISKQGSYEESLGRVIEIKPIVMPIGRLMLNPEQLSIINLISPKLMPYLDELYSTVENLVAQLNEKLSEIATLEAKAEEMKLSIEELEAEKEELNLELEKLEASLEAIKQEKNELKEATDLTIFNLNEKVLTLTGNLDVVKAERDEKDKEIERLNQKIIALSLENERLIKENDELKKENAGLREQIDALVGINASLRITIESLEQENVRLQSQIKELNKQIEELTNPTPSEGDPNDPKDTDPSEDTEGFEDPKDLQQEGKE